MFKPNEKQKEVLEFNFKKQNKNLLVSAAAGSGKTTVMTEKIIKIIIDDNISLNDILVMTFTVKATQEMKRKIKNRIDEELSVNSENINLIKESATIQNANITTIDSFCKNIVDKYYSTLNNTNGLYSKFDPTYRIADEKELSILYDDILNDLLENVIYSDLDKYGDFVDSYFNKSGDTIIKDKLFLKGLEFLYSIPNPINKLDNWILEYTNNNLNNNNTSDININCNKNELIYLQLLKEFYIKVINEKVSRNIYAISDYATLALEILNSNDSSVCSEIKNKFKYIFIDEYQDTSLIQEEILLKIANNHNVIMIGDVKQSIYSFRNAEPEIFLNKINEAIKDNKDNHLINMNTNYRSNKNIVCFVNELFNVIMKKDFAGIDYKNNGSMEFFDNNDDDINTNNKVEVHYICSNEFKEYNENKQKDKSIKVSANSEIVEAEFIAKKIEDLVNNYGYKYKDIVILFRSLYSKVDKYIDVLSKHNIPVFAEIKKGFFDRYEIKLMQDIFNIIDNEKQDIPIVNVLCSNLFGLTNNELAFIKLTNLYFNSGENIIDAIKFSNEYLSYINNKANIKNNTIENENLNKYLEFTKNYNTIINLNELSLKLKCFIDTFNNLRLCSRYYSISELIEEIYNVLNIKNIMLSKNDGIMRVANLDMLSEFAKSYEKSSFVGLFNFLRYIEKIKQLKDDQGLAKIVDENDNVVRIMTIHASKGLEFNCVFVAGCGSSYNLKDTYSNVKVQTDVNEGIAIDYIDVNKKFSIETPKKKRIVELKTRNILKEEMRMLYVALTRAKQKLIITAAVNGSSGVYSKAVGKYKDVYKYTCTNMIKDEKPFITSVNFKGKINRIDEDCDMLTNVEDCKSYIDLILSAIRKETNFCDAYIDFLDLQNIDENKTTKLTIDKILNDKLNEKILDDYKIEEQAKNKIKTLFEKLDKETLNKNLNIEYPNINSKKILKPKFSVSEIKQEQYDFHNKEVFVTYDNEDTNIVLDKINEFDRKDSTYVGNAYHRFMQFFNFKTICDNDDILKYTSLYPSENNISEIECINYVKINTFLETDIGIKMSNAYNSNKLYREQKFMKLFSQNEINNYLQYINMTNLPENIIFDEKNVIIQGIIDAFFIDDDEKIVVIDYKTDGILKNKISEKDLVENYKIQLDIYSKALRELSGYDVKSKYLYSFTLDKFIEII